MASLVLGIAGGAIGTAVGGPMGGKIGFMLGSAIGSIADQWLFRSPPIPYGQLQDLRVSSSAYGTPIPQGWGQFRLPGALVWSSNLQQNTYTQSQGGGGSAGPGQQTETYYYTTNAAFIICRGNEWINSNSLLRIHADDTVVWDYRDQENSKVTVRFYTGTETQDADPLIQAQYGTSNCPAFRGQCYIMLENFQVYDFGERLPNISVEIATSPVYMSDMVTNIANQYNITDDQLDVSQGTTTQIVGEVFDRRGSGCALSREGRQHLILSDGLTWER
jgi:hypothetical protein